MPAITLSLTRLKAVEIHECISAMGGEGTYKAAREQIQRAIVKAWPEVLDPAIITPDGELRPIEYNPKHQRAMAEGLLHLCRLPETNGKQFAALLKLAEEVKVLPWVEHYLGAESVPDYDFPLSGEPSLTPEAGK